MDSAVARRAMGGDDLGSSVTCGLVIVREGKSATCILCAFPPLTRYSHYLANKWKFRDQWEEASSDLTPLLSVEIFFSFFIAFFFSGLVGFCF